MVDVRVYVFLLSNDTVKIGISNNVQRRQASIISHSGLDINKSAWTERMTNAEARAIESECHRHFAPNRTRGEFFNITFDEACAYLQSKVVKPLLIGRKPLDWS